MGINLFKHNQEAYDKLVEMYKTVNRAAIIHPTGSGKSYIPLKLMEDNPNAKVLYLSPSVQILHQIKKNIFSSGMTMRSFKNLKRMTYQKLIRLSEEEMSEIAPDVIVIDEFHHLGRIWGEVVKKLLNMYPNAKVLGLSATPMRYNDGEEERDMATELFGDNIASEMTLEQAINKGIYQKPEYTVGLYAYQEIVEEFERKIERIDDGEQKQEAIKGLASLKNMLQEATTSLPQLLESSMKNKTGKYIVYCRNIADMKEKMARVNEMFGTVNSNIDVMSMSSDESFRDNERTINAFEQNNDPTKLKLLFSVNMLNEGYHLKDIDGVIMMRPTHSPTLYTQQLGRALSVGSNKTPVVIDLVNNIDSIKITEGFFKSLDGLEEKIDDEPNKETIQPSPFRIYKGYREIKTLIDKIDGLTSRQNYTNEEKLEVLKRFAATGEKISRNTVFEGHPIYNWRTDVRNAYKNNLINISKEEEEQLFSLGVLTKTTPTNEEKAKRICQWIEEHGNTKLPARNNRADEEDLLGTWLSHYRTKKTKEEREKYMQGNPFAAEVFEKIDLVEEYNRKVLEERAKKICDWITAHGDMKLPKRNSKDEEENLLGVWSLVYISRLEKEKREQFIKENPFAVSVFEKIDLVEMNTKNQIPIQIKNLQVLESWFEESGKNLFPPSPDSKDEKEREAGLKYRSIKGRISKFLNVTNPEEIQECINADSEGAAIFYAVQRMKKEVAKKYLAHVLNVKNWCIEHGTFDLPRENSEDGTEKELARHLGIVRRNVSKYLTSQDEKAKKEFEELHPDIAEIISALNYLGIDCEKKQKRQTFRTQRDVANERQQNNVSKAKLYKEWILSHPAKGKPSRVNYEDEEEKSIAIMHNGLMEVYVSPYLKLKTDDERAEYLKRYPEILEIISIFNEADDFVQTNKKTRLIQKAQNIKDWLEERTDSHTLPSKASGGEQGDKLNNDYWYLKATYVKPYLECVTDEERLAFAQKYDDAIEVITILNSIDAELDFRRKRVKEQIRIEEEAQNPKKVVLTPLERMKKVREWVVAHDFSKMPSSRSKDEDEAELGIVFKSLKSEFINPYLRLKDEVDKSQFREQHPEIEEMVNILCEIEVRTGKTVLPTHLANIRSVKYWYNEDGRKILPRYYTPSSEEEKKLARAYRKARERVVKSYSKLETEEQKRRFEEKHPELPEIVFTMQEMESETKEGVHELTSLVLEYWQKRGFLEEAKRLEAEYKEILKQKERERRMRIGEIDND